MNVQTKAEVVSADHGRSPEKGHIVSVFNTYKRVNFVLIVLQCSSVSVMFCHGLVP